MDEQPKTEVNMKTEVMIEDNKDIPGTGRRFSLETQDVEIGHNDDSVVASLSPSQTRLDDAISNRKSVHWSPDLVAESHELRQDYDTFNDNKRSNPYISSSPADPAVSFSVKEAMGTVRDTIGRWGKKVGETSKKAEELAGNAWQHLRTAPSFADAAMGRIAQGAKVLAEGGYESIFRRTFETVPEEQLQDSFACFLSTSAGPVMGVLYISTEKLAFCSDNPLSYKSNGRSEWSYYKVIIPLHQLRAASPSSSKPNPSEKYIQVISVDDHEFWFMGFLKYQEAVQCLQAILETRL